MVRKMSDLDLPLPEGIEAIDLLNQSGGNIEVSVYGVRIDRCSIANRID